MWYTISLILILTAGKDLLFLAKIDAFNRSNKLYLAIVNFVEASYAIIAIKVVLDLMTGHILFALVFGMGSVTGGLISSVIKGKLDNRLEGQKKFYARIALDDDIDRSELIKTLAARGYEFTLDTKEYITGKTRTVIQGSLENRKRMLELKEILRGRKNKHVVILRAEDVYLLR